MALRIDYPWTASGLLIVSAPMMKISLAQYALATSAAGGIGFLAAGFDLTTLRSELTEAAKILQQGHYPSLSLHHGLLPIGLGVQNWGANINLFVDALKEHPVTAVWFFAPKHVSDLTMWAEATHRIDRRIKIWVQVGTVTEAREVSKLISPDVLVVQGADAGGHGLAQRAGIISLLPEVADMLTKEKCSVPLIAAGGIMDGRGAAAALTLGAQGVCLGTRLLASHEAVIAKGYQDEVLRASDGGLHTTSSSVYDKARGIKGWPQAYQGRGIINQSYLDVQAGMTDEENQNLYAEEIKKGDEGWGPKGRMTTYAGTGVGLVKEVMSIEQIFLSIRDGAHRTVTALAETLAR